MDSKDKKIIKEEIREELYLRDYLAADRTILAIDRTLLSYVRTALTMFVAGVSFLKFFDTFLLHSIGWFLIILTIATLVIGTQRYLLAVKLINKRKSKSKAYTSALISVDINEVEN